MAARLCIKLLALTVVGVAAVASRSVVTPPPAAAGPEQTHASSLRAVGTVHPRLSPNGRVVVFSYQGSIWRVPATGGVMKRLAAGAGFAFEPCWSADGRRVAFQQGKAWGSGQVRVIDSETGEPIPVAPPVLASGKLFFSPDGNHLFGNLRRERQVEASARST